MTLIFRETMDRHSDDVYIDDRRVASVQWHPEREPQVVFPAGDHRFVSLDLEVLEQIVEHGKEMSKRKR